MTVIRALVVDDSAVVRKIVTKVLTDAGINVVAQAISGDAALKMLPDLDVDVVTLDIEMPGRNGIETLRELRKTHPRLPVIMLSTLTERGAIATLDALGAGASDYVTKPTNAGSSDAAMEQVRSALIPKIEALCGTRRNSIAKSAPLASSPNTTATSILPSTARLSTPRSPIDVVAIGVSTGGPNALAEVLGSIAVLPVPVVIVQHMPAVFTKLLAERLDASSKLHVSEAIDGQALSAGTAVIAPGDFHMEVTGTKTAPRISLNQNEPEQWCRPAVDPLFRSVKNVFGANVLGIVLTGMGHDGFSGAQILHDAGATIVAQDEASSVVWGMPSFIAKAGIASAVLPLSEMAKTIESLTATRVRNVAGALQ